MNKHKKKKYFLYEYGKHYYFIFDFKKTRNSCTYLPARTSRTYS